MKITKYGVVIITETKIRVEGWQVEREATDPEGATNEQLLLYTVIKWAQKKFDAEANKAFMLAAKDAKQREKPPADRPEIDGFGN